MSDTGFNNSQLKQLTELFEVNNKALKDEMKTGFTHVYTSLGEVEENLGNRIDEAKKELVEKIESEIYAVKTVLRDDIKNLALTMATKYEVKQLQDKVGISS